MKYFKCVKKQIKMKALQPNLAHALWVVRSVVHCVSKDLKKKQ